MQYKAVYRCRLCGKEYRPGITTDQAMAVAHMEELAAGLCGTVPVAPRLTEPHPCHDGSLGVADFLGWKADYSHVYDESLSGLLED